MRSKPASQHYWVFTGDTAHNPTLWKRLNRMDVAMLVIETAFSNGESRIAERSLHLCPDSLAAELACIAPGRRYPVYVTHTKPAETQRIMAEIQHLDVTSPSAAGPAHGIRWLSAGQVVEV